MTRALRQIDEGIALVEMAIIVVGLAVMVAAYTVGTVVRFGPDIGWIVLVAGVVGGLGGAIWFPRATPAHVETAFSMVLFGMAAGLIGAAAIARIQTAWAIDLCRAVFLWVAFAGASLATKASKHLNIDVLDKALTGRIRDVTAGIALFVAAGFCAVMVWVTADYSRRLLEHCIAMEALRLPEWLDVLWPDRSLMCFAPGHGFPRWFVAAFFPVGFGMMALRFAGHGWTYVQGRAERPDEAADAVAATRKPE